MSFVQFNKNPPESKTDLHCPESYIIKGNQILPFLLDIPPSALKNGVKPSEVLAALKLSTEERLEKLRSPLRKYRLGSKKDPFSRCPEVIIFQNFKIGVTYHATLTITNQRTVPQDINVYFETSRFFTLTMDCEYCKLTRIAPGMSNVFNISFLPTDTYRDYVHEIRFVSREKQFTVPIYAIGPRPIAYMPDKVVLPPTLVKVETTQTIVLKNSGEVPLNFSKVVTEPFSCNVTKGLVPTNGLVEVKYSCYPVKPGYTVGRADTYFRNDIFITVELECEVGKILPKSEFEFSVIFTPQKNIFYYHAAYLDIEGTEKRVRASLQGFGVGPPVVLTVKSLNVGQIYLTDKHQYELAITNKGIIPATVTYQPKKTDWGGTLTCLPESLHIKPASSKALVVLFYSELQGEFIETLDFQVEESGEHLQCIFRGNVICPLLKCVPEMLDFGTICVGICSAKEISLVNESRVSIKYDFEFEEDFEKKGSQYVQIIPRHGKVEASSADNVKVAFCCDFTSEWKTNLLLVMWNSRMYTTKIPLTCKCACPKMSCKPETVSIKFCFLNADYNRTIELTNDTDLPGYVEYITPKTDSDVESRFIVCSPSTTKLYFNPRETIQLGLKINVSNLGPHKLPLKFSIIGGGEQTLCTIICNGQGPVVSYSPDEVDFGVIDVLQRRDQKLTLINDSPILAKIRVYCKSNIFFHIEERDSTLQLSSEEKRDITVWAMFNTSGKNKDTIYVEIYQGDVCTIKVSGEGTGTSILCEPALAPSLHLGTILTYKPFAREVRVTNKGILRHKMLFTKRNNVRSLKEDEEDNIIPTVFKISPLYLDLESNQTGPISIKCSSLKPKLIKEEYFCYALVGKSSVVQCIFNFCVEAEFVDPNLSFSKRNVDFKIEVVGNVAEGRTQAEIHVDNQTGIPLHIHISLDDRENIFQMVDLGERFATVTQEVNRSSVLSVNFCPPIRKKRRFSQKARLIVEYENHPKTDIINLHGEVMFPTVKLYPCEINFHCVPLGSTSQKNVIIQNVSAMMVYFKWYWLEKSVKVSKLTPVKESPRSIKMAAGPVSANVFMEYINNPRIYTETSDDTADASLKQSLCSDRYMSSACEVRFIYDTSQYLAEMRTVLAVAFSRYKSENAERLNAKDTTQSYSKSITKLFSLEPSEGILKPSEYSVITLAFNPPPNSDIMATAICKIEGGEEEQITVKGKSSKLSYVLDKNCVNFGNQVFCELCTDHLVLTNNGLCTIDFKIFIEESMNLQSEMMDIHPRNGAVLPGSSLTFKVDYFPGFPGNFNKSFMLELGYLEPVTVNVRGYAVLSQAYLLVPRPDMQLSIDDCYKALAWITPEYLELVQTNDRDEIDDEPKDPRHFLEENDWVCVSYNDSYPSLMDIDMAMERIAAFNLIDKNPKILREHNVTKRVSNIPHFSTAPYCVDFGYIVRGVPVCYTVLVYNYGPINADVKLMEDNKTALLEKEIKIEFKPKILAPGDTNDLYVIFAPTIKKFPDLDKEVEDVFRLSVKHGPIIPVRVKAQVTLPVVSFEHEELHFNKVYCGDVLRKTVLLHNDGNVKSKWFASISKPTRKGDAIAFFIIPKTGELDPGKKTYLEIYFVPTISIQIRRTLRIDVESNRQQVVMDLYGEGMDPALMIVPTELHFSPTLSYFENTLYFAVQNMAEISMDFYFPTFDCETEHEKMLIQVYLKHKNLKQMFIPLRISGQGLPEFFTTTYYKLVEKLRHKMLGGSDKKSDDTQNKADDAEGEVVEVKAVHRTHEVEDPLAKYSPKELNSLLMEYIMAEGFDSDCTTDAKCTTYRMDDSSDKIEIIEPLPKPIQDDIERKGILFIFHGAPTTDYYKAANQVGIALSVPVYSIDRLIIESLVEETNDIQSDILETIENAFLACLNPKTDTALLQSIEAEDSPYDKILDKINVILTSKHKKDIKKGTPKEKESKVSSEKSFGKPRGSVGDCFLNISSEFIAELLKPKLKGFSKLVIESLNSTFIPQQNLALYTILKAAGSLQYIDLILFSFTVADYIKNEEAKLQAVENIAAGIPEAQPIKAPQAVVKTSSEKRGKASTKAGSEKSPEKVSKISQKVPPKPASGKAVEMNKSLKIVQVMNKVLKAQLEDFESLRSEIWHVVHNWDKRNGSMRKPYIAGHGGKKDTGTKDSARTGRNSVKKPTSTSYLEEVAFEPGINFSLVLNSTTERQVDFAETIRNTLSRDPDLQRVFSEIEERHKEKFEESDVEFSVISKPITRKNELSSVFCIKNVQGKDHSYPIKSRTKSGTSIKHVKRRRTSKGSRKSSDSKIGAEPTSISFAKGDTDMEFSPKTVLLPGDLVKYQVTFCPKKSGFYKYTITLEAPRNKAPYRVVCSARCELPAIDLTPEVMFPRTLENYREKASYDHFVFIKDQKIFDFGSIIASSSPEKSILYCTSILLRNISSSNCDVTVCVSNETFGIEPTNFLIAPKGEAILKLSTKPTRVGTLTAQLYLSIKNNPKVEEFTLACSPCRLEFSVYPRTINFDKVPLNYSAKRFVRLTNTSPINVRWEFVDPGWATETFNLSQEGGFIPLYSTNEILFRFHPTEETSFPKRTLPLRVFDVNSASTEPCYIENIVIHADSVEYNLSLDDHIDFGEIKGGIDYKRTFAITNKGKCEVILKIETIQNPLEGDNFVRDYIKIQPLMLIMGAQKTENLSIVFHPKSSFTVSNLLIFVVSMVESIQSGHVVKSYRVGLNATSFMPSYKLCPQSVMNFGYVPINTTNKLVLELTNKGRFSFSFVIQDYAKITEASKKGTGDKKGARAISANQGTASKARESEGKSSENTKDSKAKSKEDSKTSKADKSKVTKITQLTLDGFFLTPSSGIVNPDDKFLVDVEFTPKELKEYQQKILIHVAEIADLYKNKIVTLEGIGCEPKINLKDFVSIFTDQYTVPNIEDFVLPKNVDGCCVFCSSSTSLYFKLVCVGTSLTTRLYFRNVGYATSHVTAKIEDPSRNAFLVHPSLIILEPHLSGYFEVTFKPDSLQIITGSLEVSYNSSVDNKLVIQLCGQGCLPQIKLLKPLNDTTDPTINFGPICVGYTRKERIAFKNIGQIKCKVIVELAASDEVLTLVPTSTTFKQLNVQDEECTQDMRHDIMVKLLLDEVAEFDVVYKPIKAELVQAVLRLHTIHNPYEIDKILINATSFDNDVIVEDLEPFKLSTPQSSNSSLVAKNSIGYILDLGHKQLNKLYKKSFLIRNKSNQHIYKFRFYCPPPVTFIPEVGHLKPDAFKEILVIFKALSPVLLKTVEINCNICKIQYTSHDPYSLSWDDRQKFVYWVDNGSYSSSLESSFKGSSGPSREPSNSTVRTLDLDARSGARTKVIMEGVEPDLITLPDSLDIISLYLTVIADYCKYQCDTTVIDFEDTYVNEKTCLNFNVQNTGNVSIPITWNICDKSSIWDTRRSTSETNFTYNTMIQEKSLKSVSSTSLFSSVYSTEAEKPLPFIINPERVVIEPGEVQTFSLSFCPQEENFFKGFLKSSIDALDPTLEDISIAVNARALPIPFYFEMEDGSSTNKDITLGFENIGLGTESIRRVLLVNPNEEQISFEIVARDKREFSHFVCENSQGTIKKKKKCFVTFSFRPPIFGSFNENYALMIPEKDVEKNVLLHGLCREPTVYFTKTSFSLQDTIPKVKTTKSLKLKNDETFPISFKFIKKSLFSDCQREKLEVYPVVGRLKPRDETDIKITFTTLNIVSTNFHVKCLIEKLKSPLSLRISAQSLQVKPSVSYINRNGEVICLSENKVNVIDLGYIYKGRRDIVSFKIINEGHTGMFYTWEFDSKQIAHFIKVSVSSDSEKEFLKAGNTATTDLIFDTKRAGILKQFKINLNVMFGPVYAMHINAISDKPCYSFSFNAYDFGYCLTQTGKTNYYNTVLCFKNVDCKKIRVENLFGKTDYLTVDFSSSAVSPGEARNIPISFHPQNVGSFKSEVLFAIGGNKHSIRITGEAVDVNLELCNPKDKFINFGEVLVQTVKKYRVGVCNNTPARIDAHFDLFDNLMIHKRRIEKLDNVMKMPVIASPQSDAKNVKAGKKGDKKPEEKPKEDKPKPDKKSDKGKFNKDELKQNEDRAAAEQLLKKQAEERNESLKCIMIVPNMFIDVPPRGRGYFDIVFRPIKKIEFEEKIYLETQDHTEPFCVIKGSTVVSEFSLNTKEVFFPGVVIGCSSTQLITLKNTGDVIGSFSWKIDDKRNLFTIEPKQGFVLPKNDMKIKVTFLPKFEKCQFRVKAKCLIKEFKECLDLVLKGHSVKIPEPTATITFKGSVREKMIDHSVSITNNTAEKWVVKSEISQGSHEAFSAPKEIFLKPFSSGQVLVTYLPLNMFLPKPDEGKLFFQLPDGTGLLYKLIGYVEAPKVKEKIEREIRCKQNFFETIPIENWLTTTQKFKVSTELLSPVTTKTLYKVFGFKTIELSGMELAKYKWGVYVVNEGPMDFRVTFKNPHTGEYVFFEISLKVLPSEPIETLHFKTNVREPVTKHITLENPVDVPITYVLECFERSLLFPKLVNMEPYTSSKIDITYAPLHCENMSTSLHARCEELGTYTYLIKAKAEPPMMEDTIIITSELGAKGTKGILFKNTADRTVEFSHKFECEEFYMERCSPIAAGDTSKIIVAFEPSKLGCSKGKLFLTSPVAGEYVYPLEGEGIPPTPKGPFTVKFNYPTSIEFKNPFHEDKEFKFNLVPDMFCCDFNENIIKAKKTTKFLVYLRPGTEASPSCSVTGKLIIYSVDIPVIQWKYYLEFKPHPTHS